MPREYHPDCRVRSTVGNRNARCRLLAAWAVLLTIGGALTGCVYRIDIQQGNLLEDADIGQVEVGMTRSQVQFLLGTPMVADSFHRDRWDYAYYLRKGRSPDAERRWVVVYFENDRVAKVERDVPMQPQS